MRDFVSVDVGVVVSCMIDGVGVGGLAGTAHRSADDDGDL